VSILCNVANVSRSGFYLYLKEKNERETKDEKDYHLIKGVFTIKLGARTVKMKLVVSIFNNEQLSDIGCRSVKFLFHTN